MGVPQFGFGMRYSKDVHMSCLSLWRGRGHRFLLYTQLGRRERLHLGLDTWHHNSKKSSDWDTCYFLLQVIVCVTHPSVRSSEVAITSFGIGHKRSQKNKLKAFSGGPRNCIMLPWDDASCSRQRCYRCSGYCHCLNFVCGQGRRGIGRSTLKGTHTCNIVAKHGCALIHSCHHRLVQKAFDKVLSEPPLHSLYLWQAKIDMLIIQPLIRQRKNRTRLQQGHVKPQVNEVLLQMKRFVSQKSHCCIWDTRSLSLRIYFQDGTCLKEVCYQNFPTPLTCSDNSERYTHWW